MMSSGSHSIAPPLLHTHKHGRACMHTHTLTHRGGRLLGPRATGQGSPVSVSANLSFLSVSACVSVCLCVEACLFWCVRVDMQASVYVITIHFFFICLNFLEDCVMCLAMYVPPCRLWALAQSPSNLDQCSSTPQPTPRSLALPKLACQRTLWCSPLLRLPVSGKLGRGWR